ncbi:MAG: hypothetical protein ACRCVW_05815 [Brevinema sp.]
MIFLFSQKLLHVYQQYRKYIHMIFLLVALLLVFSIVSFFSLLTKTFYYINKDNQTPITEYRKVARIKEYSNIENILRTYLNGSLDYKGYIPFMNLSHLISVSYDLKKKVLVLNWDTYFLSIINNKYFDSDIYYLLKTIKKNTHFHKVYFLVNNHTVDIAWRHYNLSSGIVLKEIE